MDIEKFYRTWKWKKKREYILKRDNNECQLCKLKGKFNRGNIVHHKQHLKNRPDLAMDDNNLITVCFDCHEELHPEHHRCKVMLRKYSKEQW
ncbi:MAG: HNH endonuclease [Oscillospiraceae bacterium]